MRPTSFIPELQRFLRDRLVDRPEGSYSVQLMSDRVLAQRKLMEEAFEVCAEVQADEPDGAALASEAADLVFHLIALLTAADVDWAAVEGMLRERHTGASGATATRVSRTVGTTTVSGTPVPDETTGTDGTGRVGFTVGTTTVSGTPVVDDSDPTAEDR